MARRTWPRTVYQTRCTADFTRSAGVLIGVLSDPALPVRRPAGGRGRDSSAAPRSVVPKQAAEHDSSRRFPCDSNVQGSPCHAWRDSNH